MSYSKENYQANREKRIESVMRYRRRDPEKWREKYRTYSQTLRGRISALCRSARLRAKRFGVTNTLTLDQAIALIEAANGKCAYCLRTEISLGFDHRVPMSQGGANAIENIVVVCWDCNVLKGRNTSSIVQVSLLTNPQPHVLEREMVQHLQGKNTEACRRWRERHRNQSRAYRLDYYQRNRAKLNVQAKARRETYRGHLRAIASYHRFRAKKYGVTSTLTVVELATLYDAAQGKCSKCGIAASVLTLDHVIPMSQGGSNSLSNVVVVCMACNRETGIHRRVLSQRHEGMAL
jgi:5-methylcytosine-specific restriction endonuclease McrA